MICPACSKEIVADAFFCTWCDGFVASPGQGTKAGLFARWVALVIDPLLAVVLYFVGISLVGGLTGSQDMAVVVAVLLPFAYLLWFLSLLRKGLTPGKQLLRLQVVDQKTGRIPGFGKMFVREVVGRFVSAMVFGIGYLWAIFDKNGQAWHDKIAGTVVLKVARK